MRASSKTLVSSFTEYNTMFILEIMVPFKLKQSIKPAMIYGTALLRLSEPPQPEASNTMLSFIYSLWSISTVENSEISCQFFVLCAFWIERPTGLWGWSWAAADAADLWSADRVKAARWDVKAKKHSLAKQEKTKETSHKHVCLLVG